MAHHWWVQMTRFFTLYMFVYLVQQFLLCKKVGFLNKFYKRYIFWLDFDHFVDICCTLWYFGRIIDCIELLLLLLWSGCQKVEQNTEESKKKRIQILILISWCAKYQMFEKLLKNTIKYKHTKHIYFLSSWLNKNLGKIYFGCGVMQTIS